MPLDEADLAALHRRMARPLYNVVYRRVWSAEEADEVVQDSFLRLWGMRERVRPETVEPLLWRITLNQASKRRRWASVRRWIGLDDGVAAPDGDAESRAFAVRAAVDELPDKLRDVVLLCEFSELSYAEVAAILDIPAGTVASRRSAAVAKLRGMMEAP